MAQTQRRKIEIFSAGCATCRETIDMVRRLAGANHDIEIHDMQHAHVATRAKQLGAQRLPAVVIDGKLAGCCTVRGADEAILRQELS